MLGGHSSAVGHARINHDFGRDYRDSSNDGTYWRLTPNQRESLLRFALSIAPRVRASEREALNKPHEANKRKTDLLMQKKFLAAKKE